MSEISLIVGIFLIIVGILSLIIGILYLAKVGYWYNKLVSKRSEKSIRNTGIFTIVLGILFLIIGILDLFFPY